METSSRVMSQASAAQPRAAEREANKNLLGRQAILIENWRKMVISMHKKQQGPLVCFGRLERQYKAKPQ